MLISQLRKTLTLADHEMHSVDYEEHGGTGNARNPFDAADRAQQEEERRGILINYHIE